MKRRMNTMLVAAAATVALAACGSTPEDAEVLGATASESEQQAAAEEADGAEPDSPGDDDRGEDKAAEGNPSKSEPGTSDAGTSDAGTSDHERGNEPDEPSGQAHGGGSTQDGDDGGTPWHLLPEADRPEPVEQPECERTSPTPVAC